METNNLKNILKEISKATKSTREYINSIVDKDSFVETDTFLSTRAFDDKEALGEGVITGYATFNGSPIQIFAQNIDVLKGSLSKAHAQKIENTINRAINTRTPLISIIDSYGARVGDGVSLLEGYGKILSLASDLNAVAPHIAIVKGAALGMMAAYVASADFVLMAKDAVMSFNPPMYLVSDAKTFPIDYKKHIGFDAYDKNSDMVLDKFDSNDELINKLNKIFSVIYGAEETDDDPNRVDPNLETMDAQKALDVILDAGDKIEIGVNYADEVKCVIARLNGICVGALATKGDYISKEGLEKAINFVNKVDMLSIPLVTLVDTKGLNATLSQEVAGYSKLAFKLIEAIANICEPKIGVAYGNAIGYGYTALMSKALGFGYTLATTNAKISPVAEEVSVAMMADQLKTQDRNDNITKLSKEYAEMQENPILIAKEGYLDNVVEATNLRPYLASALLMLEGM